MRLMRKALKGLQSPATLDEVMGLVPECQWQASRERAQRTNKGRADVTLSDHLGMEMTLPQSVLLGVVL